MIITGTNRSTRRYIAPSAMLSTIKPIRPGPGLNPALGSEKPVTRSKTFRYAAEEGSKEYGPNS